MLDNALTLFICWAVSGKLTSNVKIYYYLPSWLSTFLPVNTSRFAILFEPKFPNPLSVLSLRFSLSSGPKPRSLKVSVELSGSENPYVKQSGRQLSESYPSVT